MGKHITRPGPGDSLFTSMLIYMNAHLPCLQDHVYDTVRFRFTAHDVTFARSRKLNLTQFLCIELKVMYLLIQIITY